MLTYKATFAKNSTWQNFLNYIKLIQFLFMSKQKKYDILLIHRIHSVEFYIIFLLMFFDSLKTLKINFIEIHHHYF